MNLTETFRQSWQKLKPANGAALLAVSGGLDSMAMAHLFFDAGIELAVAHCNFGLREDESDGDEDFVKRWCDDRQVRFFVAHFDTAKEAEEMGTGIQETARNLRYKWFEAVRTAYHFTAICTAHHADDNAETMLINLMRGTGIAGLHGIPAKNGYVLRPLLFADRKILQQYAATNQIAYREDSSNSGDYYLRNAIRHQVLPILEEQMPGTAKRMMETSQRISEAEMIYDNAIKLERNKLLQKRGADYYVPVKLLINREPLNTICYELFHEFGFITQQIPFITDLLVAESGRYLTSLTHRIIRNRDFLIVTTTKPEQADFILINDLKNDIATSDHHFHFSELNEPPKQLDADASIAYLDMSKLEAPLLLRRWKTGDYFYPFGMGMKKKKLSRYFIDQKLPVHEKEKIWVLESNKRIVWVCGMRMDERFKVKSTTGSILKIKMSPVLSH